MINPPPAEPLPGGKRLPDNVFSLDDARTLRIQVGSTVWMRSTAILAHHGDLVFNAAGRSRASAGILLGIARKLRRELVQVTGQGAVQLADSGKRIRLVRVGEEGVTVDADELLAFDFTLSVRIRLLQSLSSWMASSHGRVELAGAGMLALTTRWEWEEVMAGTPQAVAPKPRPSVAWSQSWAWQSSRMCEGATEAQA